MQKTTNPPLVSIIIATYKEADVIVSTILSLVENLPKPLEIIVVDDSPDEQTIQQLDGLFIDNMTVIHRTKTKGLASAIMRGVIESRGDIIGWIDADAWMMPKVLPKMIDKLADHDMVVASRYVPGGDDMRGSTRKIASHLVNGFAKIVLGSDIKDYTSNFVVLKRTVFDHVVPMPYGFGEFFIELIYRAHRVGLSIHEYPYVLEHHDQGQSKAFPNWWRFLNLGFMYGVRILIIRVHAFFKYL